jgi:hypothetical protein
MIAGEILLYGQFQHRIGQLDFIAGAPFLIFEYAEHLGLQYIAAIDRDWMALCVVRQAHHEGG